MSWTWNKTNGDWWSNALFETRGEAIEEAKGCGEKDFYVGECELIPLRTDVDPDRIMEELDEAYSNDSGCDDYIYEEVSKENIQWFAEKLSELVEEFHEKAEIKSHCFKVISEEHIVL
ncbi:hypothetical protein [Anaerosporobacter sp.]|uniref:hypothetical protein n=1 Tax=Anaerosporobacter sp. TaxID=1872529 RepID=UPI00286F039A|nr:hypothetical protein [Anaerosporobacter sp.]